MGGRNEEAGRSAYERLAASYDDFTLGYQAERWTASLEGIAVGQGPQGRRLLDVGCGTGKSFIPMIERGWEVVGCDISPAMLAVARSKVGESVPLHVCDVRELPVLGEFDLVWALNDTLNNLVTDAELGDALAGLRANLKPAGVLLFDLNTLSGMREMFASEFIREVGGRKMRWIGQSGDGVEPDSVSWARFEVDGEPDADHDHRQRHFSQDVVLRELESAGLECQAVWGDYEGEQTQPLDEAQHQKAIYLARSR
ncbi:MAG TPA: class I SAM-dependent methyltransferase [Solirubrobacterales bacterium]|nr:class I SAM-dependent methyltransferase [Solirubrobacterales bacterium]